MTVAILCVEKLTGSAVGPENIECYIIDIGLQPVAICIIVRCTIVYLYSFSVTEIELMSNFDVCHTVVISRLLFI